VPQGKPYLGRYLGYGSDWWAVWAAGARHSAFPLTVYHREILTRSCSKVHKTMAKPLRGYDVHRTSSLGPRAKHAGTPGACIFVG
jgi:hypothetical protein